MWGWCKQNADHPGRKKKLSFRTDGTDHDSVLVVDPPDKLQVVDDVVQVLHAVGHLHDGAGDARDVALQGVVWNGQGGRGIRISLFNCFSCKYVCNTGVCAKKCPSGCKKNPFVCTSIRWIGE